MRAHFLRINFFIFAWRTIKKERERSGPRRGLADGARQEPISRTPAATVRSHSGRHVIGDRTSWRRAGISVDIER